MRRATFVLTLLLAAPTMAVELAPLADAPVKGLPTTLTLKRAGAPAAGVSVTAVYRENAHESLRREQLVGRTDDSGHVVWTPEQAGVVVLQWEGGSHNVSVLYDGIPAAAILVAVLAGLALLGGSVVFFIQMLRQPDSEMIEEAERLGEPPST